MPAGIAEPRLDARHRVFNRRKKPPYSPLRCGRSTMECAFIPIVMTALLLDVIAIIMPGRDCSYTLFRVTIIVRRTEISL